MVFEGLCISEWPFSACCELMHLICTVFVHKYNQNINYVSNSIMDNRKEEIRRYIRTQHTVEDWLTIQAIDNYLT